MTNDNRREESVRLFIMSKGKYFDSASIPYIGEKLMQMNETQFMIANSLDYKDPMMMLVISIVGGTFGIDRFMIGDIGIGILKLMTAGLCGIMTVIDWFLIQNRTKEYNMKRFLSLY